MAAIFCLFSVTLCQFSEHKNTFSDISNDYDDDNFIPLSSQFVTVPRVHISPCPETFRYAFNGNEWLGLIAIKAAPIGRPSKIKIILSIGFHLKSKYTGEISLTKERSRVIKDISKGLPIMYRIRFPIQNPIPKVTEIYYNDRLICMGQKDVGQFTTSITLDHTLYTGIASSSKVTKNANKRRQKSPPPVIFQPIPTKASKWTTDNKDVEFDKINFECGLSDYVIPKASGLIIDGRTASRGQFPWLAAYYHHGAGDNGFICGGSLISRKLVITAAHCIQVKKSNLRRKAEDSSFFIGKHNLESLQGEQNYILSNVEEFVIHPDWNINEDSYDADIAIAVLTRTIHPNKFIKPICIWETSSGYEDLIGRKGVVVGWGKTETNALSTTYPKWTEIPIVSEITCLRSNDAFRQITSSRTFCAGIRIEIGNGATGPCSGDSGGSFAIFRNGRWFLRGIISSSLYDPILSTCDTKNYAVFTDTTQFIFWINDKIKTYG